jgi:hypothetical protein
VFTASAWPEQVLFWSADYPREAADSLVRRLPFGGLGALAPGRPRTLHDDLVSAVSKGVQRAVGEDGIVEEGHSFVHRAVTRGDRGGPPMALDEHIVEIARMLGGELAQAGGGAGPARASSAVPARRSYRPGTDGAPAGARGRGRDRS